MKAPLLFISIGLFYSACNTSGNLKREELADDPEDVSVVEEISSTPAEDTVTTGDISDVAELPPEKAVEENKKKEGSGIKIRGIQRDEGEAKKLFEQAEKYEFGDGVKKDVEKAIELYRKAAEMDFAQAQYSLAFLVKDEKESLKWLTKSAQNGYSDAQYELAIQYLYGYGVSPDIKKSIYWFEKSAKNGHKIGQYKLGLMYDTGEGVGQNLVRAAQLYRMSADQGVGIAQFNLAMMYITGEGVDSVDMNMAAFWMDKARVAGVRDAKKAWSKFHLDEYN